jgi:hypothetical protein
MYIAQTLKTQFAKHFDLIKLKHIHGN